MITNNSWLFRELRKLPNLALSSTYDPLIEVHFEGRSYRIYSPESSEYIITCDIVEKVEAMGGNVISYPTSWCQASMEAESFGKTKGVDVIPHARLFKILSK